MRLTALAVLAVLCGGPAAAQKRPLPDYDGRGDQPTRAGDVLIWVPRILASPFYLVSEYVLRRPLEALVVTGEREQWPARIVELLFDRQFGIVPIFYVDLGLRPTGGLYVFWNDAGAPWNQVRATASFSANVVTATLLDRIVLGDGRWRLSLRSALSLRSDELFYGLGPGTRSEDKSRYESDQLEAGVGVELRSGRLGRARLEVGARSVSYGDGACCGDPSIADLVVEGRLPPPGLAEGGHTGPYGRLRLVLDGRARAPGTGVALAVDAEQGSDPATDRVWIRAGATLGGSVELGWRHRVISLILHAALAEPLAGSDVPFTEQATLGGSGPLPGFGPGRLAGRSAVAATLQYEWPVWAYLTGVLHAGTGEIFGEGWDGLAASRLRGSTGIGIRSVGITDHRFEIVLAIGTEPFGDGGEIDSVRIVFGGETAF